MRCSTFQVVHVSYPSCSTRITSNNSNIRTHRNEILAAWHVFKRNKTRMHPMARRSEGGILHSVCGTNPSHWYETKTQCTSLRCSSLFTRNTLKPKTCSSCIFSTTVLIYTDLTYIHIHFNIYLWYILSYMFFYEKQHSSLPTWFSVKAKFNPQPTPAFSPERHGAVQCGSRNSWFLWPQRGMVHRRRSGGVWGYKSDPFTLRNISKKLDSYLQCTCLQSSSV